MKFSFKVILIPHQREKDLISNIKSRFFLSGGQTGAKAQNDNTLCALMT
jgi:hypothetical protein